LPFIAVGAASSLAGNHFGARLPQARLRRIFGAALVLLGIYVMARSLPALIG